MLQKNYIRSLNQSSYFPQFKIVNIENFIISEFESIRKSYNDFIPLEENSENAHRYDDSKADNVFFYLKASENIISLKNEPTQLYRQFINYTREYFKTLESDKEKDFD